MVEYVVEDGIATITLDHPPVNALSTRLWKGIEDAFARLDEDTDARVAIFTARGQRAFCAGADLKEVLEPGFDDRGKHHQAVMLKVARARVPVICAVNGPAVGAGVVLATLCDLRVAADTASFSWPEVDYGLVGGGGAHMRRISVPEGTIRDWLFTGRRISAAEALQASLVDRLFPYEALMPAVRELAGQIAEKKREALMAVKGAILAAELETDWHQGYLSARKWMEKLYGGEEMRSGIDAFLGGSRRSASAERRV